MASRNTPAKRRSYAFGHDDRVPAFNLLGTTFPEGTNVERGLHLAGLDKWNVTTRPLYYAVGETEEEVDFLEIPGRVATVRDNAATEDGYSWLGVGMTDSFVVSQNEDVAAFGSTLLDVSKGDLLLDSGGAYRYGSRCFISLRVPEAVTVGTEQIARYMLLTWGHDGSQAVTIKPHDYRIQCTNAVPSVLGDNAFPVYKVRHVGMGLHGKIDEARAALGIMFDSGDALKALVERWASVEVTDARFEQIVDRLLPVVDDGPGATRRADDRANVHAVYADEGNAGIHGTAWGALNAWTEWSEWHQGQYETAQTRALAQFTSDTFERRRNMAPAAIRYVLPQAAQRALAAV